MHLAHDGRVFIQRLGHFVGHVLGHAIVCGPNGHHRQRGHGRSLALVAVGGQLHLGVVRLLFEQGRHFGARQRNDLQGVALCKVGHRRHGHTARDQGGVQVAVLDLVHRLGERGAVFFHIGAGHAVHLEQIGHQLVLARAGRARGNAFALEVLDAVDARIGTGDQLHGLGVQRAQGPQVFQGRIGKLGFAVVGRVQNVGGHKGRLDVLGAQQFGVAHRGTGGFSGGGDFLAVDRGLVGDQLGQHAAQGVIGAAGAARGHTEKHTLLCDGRT